MNRIPYNMFEIVLDQFYSMPFNENESLDDRCIEIDAFMDSSGWSWEDIVTQQNILFDL